MNIVKAVMRKDLSVSEKTVVINAAVYILILALVFLFRFAYIYGNLADPSVFENGEEDQLLNITYMDMLLPPLLSLVFSLTASWYILSSLESDFRCGWFSVVFASGGSGHGICSAKHIESVLAMLLSMAVNFAVSTVYYSFFPRGYSAEFVLFGMLVIPFCVCVFIFLSVTLTYALKKADVVLTLIFGFAVVYAMLFMPKIMKLLENASVNSMEAIECFANAVSENIFLLVAVSAAAFVIVGAVTYFVGAVLLKRREKLCGA